MNDFLDKVFLGNSIKDWGIALGVFAGLYILIRIFKHFLIKYFTKFSEKTETTFDDFLVEVLKRSVVPALYFAAGYFAFRSLTFQEKVYDTLKVALMFVFTFYVLRTITSTIKYFVYTSLDKYDDSEVKKKQARGILIIINAIVWMLGFVFLLDNMGKDVTTIITGLGIGGIAIALAAQTILGDLFSYFVIFFDRPFEIGDYIVVDDKSGTIEYIGIKTTRIRTLTGDILVCSNTDLTNSRVHNFKKMERRRVLFTLGVLYESTPAMLEMIPGIIKDSIDAIEGITYDRSHFSGYGAFSLDFETVYYVEDSDFAYHMQKKQELFLTIFKKFSKEGIGFAYPTQTIYMGNGGDAKKEEKIETPS